MQSALWKTAALISVIGIGGFVVVKVHHELQLQQRPAATTDPKSFQPVEGTDGDSGSAGLDPDSLVELGPMSDADADFAMPPFAQSEPASDDGANGFFVAGRRPSEPRVADPEIDDAGPSDPFFAAGLPAREPQPTRIAPADSRSELDDPFAGRGTPVAESGRSTLPTAPLTTADAQLTAGPQNDVEQVAAARAFADPENFNPFANPEPAIDRDLATDAGGADDELVLPDQPTEFDPVDEAGGPAEPEPLTELSFDQDPLDPLGNPFWPVELPAEDSAPTDAVNNPFGQDFGAEPTVDSVPVLDFGDPALPESDLALPADDAPPTGLPAATFPAGPTDDPTLGFPEEPDPTDTFEPGWLDNSEPGMEPALKPLPASGVEPSRFPETSDENTAPAASARTSDLNPVTPRPVNPLPEIRPVNPNVAPRPEFVGDGTLDADAPAGPQQPELTIQKLAPANATVGDPLVYAIKVKNVGNSTAHDVIVEDRIPRGTTLQGSIPQAELVDKKLIWQLGHMEPGDEKTIRIKVVPNEPGEVGSVATVRFVAEVAATTTITTPNLSLDVQGPGEVAVGEQAVFRFRITNSGDGEAHNVYVRNLLPAGFQHPGGSDIEYDVGALKPGESRAVELAVTTTEVGQHALRAQLNTGAKTRAESSTPVSVIKSRLLIERRGPKRRFVGRPADYETIVSNRSSRPLQRIEVVEQLPAGMELAAAPEGGSFDSQRRTITWRVAELASGASMNLKTSVIANRMGTLQGAVSAVDAAGNQARLKSELEVAGFASLKVDLEHDSRPVGVGDSVAMQLRVKNRGTGAAEHVEALFDIPDHLEFVNAEGPVTYEQQGRTVRFAAIDTLAADEEQTFKIMLTAAAPGNTPVLAKLSTAELEGPLQQTGAVIVEADGQ